MRFAQAGIAALACAACTTLTVVSDGPGGIVVKDVGQPDVCLNRCTYTFFRVPSVLEVSAVPQMGASFGTWRGACERDPANPRCRLELTRDTVLYAVFPPLAH